MLVTPALRPALAVFCVLALSAPAAAEDLSPQALWQRWQAAGGDQRTISAEAARREGAALLLSGVTVTQIVEDGQLSAQIDRITLSPAAGGVAVTIAPGQTLLLRAEDAADDLEARFDLGGEGLTIAVTGPLEAPDYAFAAEALSLDLDTLVDGGTELPAEISLAVSQLTGTVEGTGRSPGAPLSAQLSGAEATAEVTFDDPASGITIRSASAQADFDGSLSFDPGGADPGAGWAVTGALRGGAGQSTSHQSSPGAGTLETRTSQDSSDLSFAYDAARATYDVTIAGMEIALSSDQFPMPPLVFRLPAAKAAVSIPTAASDAAQTARLGLTLTDLEVDEALWSLADPARALPRTTAQLALDLEGDLLVQAEPVLPGPPAAPPLPGILPQSLRIHDLSLALAEATLDAQGGFEFPTPEGARVPDLNAPVGRLDLSATGLPALIQRLSAAGILTTQQALGAQMMLGMLTTEGAGDSLTSRIVAEPGGGLLVNGNRMR